MKFAVFFDQDNQFRDESRLVKLEATNPSGVIRAETFKVDISPDCSAETIVAPASIANVPYKINDAEKTFTFPAFTSSDQYCVQDFQYEVVLGVGGTALAVGPSADLLKRNAQNTADRDVLILSTDNNDEGTKTLEIRCSNAFFGPILKTFDVVISPDCS